MKIIKSLLVFFLLTGMLAACKKDKAQTNNSLAGTWEGKWGDVNEDPSEFIKFEIKSNGTMQRLNQQGQVIAEGNWNLNGFEFTCSYTHTSNGQVHKIKGIYTDFDGAIMGTWGYSPSDANGGTIEMSKQ